MLHIEKNIFQMFRYDTHREKYFSNVSLRKVETWHPKNVCCNIAKKIFSLFSKLYVFKNLSTPLVEIFQLMSGKWRITCDTYVISTFYGLLLLVMLQLHSSYILTCVYWARESTFRLNKICFLCICQFSQPIDLSIHLKVFNSSEVFA